MKLNQRQRFAGLIIGTVGLTPALATVIAEPRDWSSFTASLVLGPLLVAAGWFGTVLYADEKITDWFNEHNALLDRAEKAEARAFNALDLLIDAKIVAEVEHAVEYAAHDEQTDALDILDRLLAGPLSSVAYNQAAKGEYVPVEPEQPAVAP